METPFLSNPMEIQDRLRLINTFFRPVTFYDNPSPEDPGIYHVVRHRDQTCFPEHVLVSDERLQVMPKYISVYTFQIKNGKTFHLGGSTFI